MQLTPGGRRVWGGGGEGEFGGGGALAGLATASGVCPRISLDPKAQGFPALRSYSPASDGRREHPVPDGSGDVLADDTSKVPTSPLQMGRGQMVPRGRRVSVPYRGMRLAGVARPALQETLVGSWM